ncbi:MAG: hypothetical protein ACR2NA_09070, partial [Solirubrobacterales bacterium]
MDPAVTCRSRHRATIPRLARGYDENDKRAPAQTTPGRVEVSLVGAIMAAISPASMACSQASTVAMAIWRAVPPWRRPWWSYRATLALVRSCRRGDFDRKPTGAGNGYVPRRRLNMVALTADTFYDCRVPRGRRLAAADEIAAS